MIQATTYITHCYVHLHIPQRSQACFIRLLHSLSAQRTGNNNLDCFIKQSNIFIYRKIIQTIYYTSLNHRANACSCFKGAPT
jgi:hypothetical protein